MATSPLGFMAHEHASYTLTVDPPRSALMSLAMLNADPQCIDVEDWVSTTAAALTPEQRRRNRLVFTGFGAALVPDKDYADLRAYLSALEAMPAADLRDQLLVNLARYGDQIVADPRLLLSDAQAYGALLQQLSPGRQPDAALVQEAHRLLNDPPALQDLIVAHLYDMSENVLGAEWERHMKRISSLRTFLEQRPLPSGT